MVSVLIVVLILALGAVAYFFLQNMDQQKQIEELQRKMDLATENS